jgi:hypothetical protein
MLLFTLIALTFSINSFSQNLLVKAGVNYSKLTFHSELQSSIEGIQWKPGFSFGITTAIQLTKNLSLESGLSFNNVGYIQKLDQGGPLDITNVKNHLNLYYLDIPVNFTESFSIGKYKAFTFLGPYIGIGLYGNLKEKYQFRNEPVTENHEVKWGADSENDDYKRLDFGLNAGTGVMFNSFQIGILFNYGLANISSNQNNNQNIQNRNFTLFIGKKIK